MALPEIIPVKYSEEEAEYLSVRPVVRQTFRLNELLDMLLCVAGKDVPRMQQILRAGTVVFHVYRYWWQGFEAPEEELRAALAGFPDADASRRFLSGECTLAWFEAGAIGGRVLGEVERREAGRKRLLRRKSFWDQLMKLTEAAPPAYQSYSYVRRGDLYRLGLTAEQAAALQEASRWAVHGVRAQLRMLRGARSVVFLCPRPNSRSV